QETDPPTLAMLPHNFPSRLASRSPGGVGLTGTGAFTSQITTVVSLLPDISRVPSEENASVVTALWCPSKQRLSLPVSGSQRRTVPSSLPEASSFPPGEKTTTLTVSRCPDRTCRSFPVTASQTLSNSSRLA